MVDSWNDVIDGLGGTAAAAEGLSEARSTISGWRSRGIPAVHWERVVAFAVDLGKSDITLEALAALAARKLETTDCEARR